MRFDALILTTLSKNQAFKKSPLPNFTIFLGFSSFFQNRILLFGFEHFHTTSRLRRKTKIDMRIGNMYTKDITMSFWSGSFSGPCGIKLEFYNGLQPMLAIKKSICCIVTFNKMFWATSNHSHFYSQPTGDLGKWSNVRYCFLDFCHTDSNAMDCR